jgi:septal ring factor EnvC (AmiA/AmiB activator)
MLRSTRKLLTVAAVTLSLTGLAAPSFADTDTAWQKAHPRREEVNNRLANQNKRIHQERKEGELTARQAKQLHREDRTIRHEERAMARTNHGHLTKAEQRSLNQQENQNSRRIGK